jgi:biopolymer transport protein ExbB
MHGFSLIKLFTRFAMLGAEWVMWVLLALSLASLAVMIERWRYYRSLDEDLRSLGARLDGLLKARDHQGARELLARSASPAALVALKGLENLDRGVDSAEHVMAGTLATVREELERGLSFLGTIGNNAPFVGLFGTVLGIIQSFDALKPPPGVTGVAAAAAAAAATGRVMGTIAEALVATAIGLLVAIPAVAAFNHFQRRIKAMLASTETLSRVVLAHARSGRHEGPSSEALREALQDLLKDARPGNPMTQLSTAHENAHSVVF